LILAVIDGTPYENGKLKPAVRELDKYIEGLEEELVKARAENEKEVSLHKGTRSQLVAAKGEAVEHCIETVEARIKTAKACRYDASYIAGMEDILVFHKASLERVKRGEDFHSTSELMTAPEPCVVCKEKPRWPGSALCASCGNEGG